MAEASERIVNGIRIRVGGSPETPRVVLLHGLGNSLEIWHAVSAHLAPLVPWAAIDIPGFGMSHRLEDETLTSVTSVLADLFEEMAWAAPHVVGHSMGGLVAWALAAQRPDAVGALSLVSAPPVQALRLIQHPRDSLRHPSVAANLLQQIVGASVPVPRGLRAKMLSSPSMRRLLLSPFVAEPSALDGEDVALALSETGGLGAARAVLASSDFDLNLMAVRTACPVSVVVGDRDRLMTSDDVAWAEEHLRAQVDILPQCGHWPHLERPAQLAEVIATRTPK